MNLKGVTPIGDVKITKQGHSKYSFKIDGYNKLVTPRLLNEVLIKLGISKTQLILELNNLTPDDLPKCKFCKINSVRIGGHNRPSKGANILNPIITECCSDDCSKRYGASNANFTKLSNGNHPSQTMTDDEKSARAVKLNITRSINGTQPFSIANRTFTVESTGFNTGPIYKFIFNDIEYGFYSKVELNLFKRYKRFFIKFYDQERFVSVYGKDKNRYRADFVLKKLYLDKTINNIKLPYVIEVKSGNLFWDPYIKNKAGEVNFKKFESLIIQDKSVFIYDKRFGILNTYYITNRNELNSLFF